LFNVAIIQAVPWRGIRKVGMQFGRPGTTHALPYRGKAQIF
jgi:hypothetical protein